jgi:recombination protein RecT
LEALLKENFNSIKSVLPEHMNPSRFGRMAINAVIKNPALAEADPNSFVMAVINCAEMGLEPSLDEAALIPYGGRVQCQPMYQGILKLCRNSGQISRIFSEVVLDGEEFSFSEGFEPQFTHTKDPARDRDTDEKALLYAYAGAVLKDGSREFVVMNRKQVEVRRNTSRGWNKKDSAWMSWPGPQWRKTALKALAKKLPKSTQLQRALTLDDQAVIGSHQTPQVADLTGMTIDLDSAAGEPRDDGKIPEPQRKSKAKAEPAEKKAAKPAEKPPTTTKKKGKAGGKKGGKKEGAKIPPREKLLEMFGRAYDTVEDDAWNKVWEEFGLGDTEVEDMDDSVIFSFLTKLRAEINARDLRPEGDNPIPPAAPADEDLPLGDPAEEGDDSPQRLISRIGELAGLVDAEAVRSAYEAGGIDPTSGKPFENYPVKVLKDVIALLEVSVDS